MKQQLSSPPRKPSLDEDSFQQLLSAAHVIQEHNDRLLSKEPTTNSDATLAEIVETQKQVLTGELDLKGAAGLIAARLQRITKSSGAAIGILENNQLTYLAGVGSAVKEVGAHTAIASALSASCLKTGKILRSPDLGAAKPSQPRRDFAVRSLIAVPILRESQIAGVVELRFAQTNAFSEDEVYACELMAALMTEALARADEMDHKEASAAEREAMLQVLEKIKPQLERLVGEPIPDLSKKVFPAEPSPPPKKQTAKTIAEKFEPSPAPPAKASKPASTAGLICRGCGREFLGDEAFCGKCGMTRTKPGGDNGHLQSKWASMWYMQQAAGQAEVKRENEVAGNGKKSHEGVAENKVAKANPPLPVSLNPSSPPISANKKEDAILQIPASKPETLKEKKSVPRLPVSLEEIVAQFATESDLLPDAPPFLEAAPEAGPIVAAVANPLENAHDWKLWPITPLTKPVTKIEEPEADAAEMEAARIESPAAAEPELEAVAPVPEAEASLYEDAPLVIRNPLGDDEISEGEIVTEDSTILVKASPWTSAANARQWLDGMHGSSASRLWIKDQWRRHHANIYLGGAALIFAASLFSLFNAPAPVARKNPAEAQLTAFEKLMVNLGLAEAPPTPVNLGNPDRQVWVDLHTALYYCPGSELYGKTAGGRYETQRSAQLDQFESASRKACD